MSLGWLDFFLLRPMTTKSIYPLSFLQLIFGVFVMRKFTTCVVLTTIITFLLIQFPVAKTYAYTNEEAAEKAFLKAQEIIVDLETGIEEAEELLKKIKERGTENEY